MAEWMGLKQPPAMGETNVEKSDRDQQLSQLRQQLARPGGSGSLEAQNNETLLDIAVSLRLIAMYLARSAEGS